MATTGDLTNLSNDVYRDLGAPLGWTRVDNFVGEEGGRKGSGVFYRCAAASRRRTSQMRDWSNQVEGCSRSSTSLMASSTRCMKVDGRRVTGP